MSNGSLASEVSVMYDRNKEIMADWSRPDLGWTKTMNSEGSDFGCKTILKITALITIRA